MVLEILFGVVYTAAALLSLWSMGQLKGFLAATPSIADRASLDRFKQLARLQMHLALAMIGLMGVGLITGMMLIPRHGLPGLGVVLAANVVVLGLGLYHKKVEVRARTLPTTSPELAEEYGRVSETWVKKALPDF